MPVTVFTFSHYWESDSTLENAMMDFISSPYSGLLESVDRFFWSYGSFSAQKFVVTDVTNLGCVFEGLHPILTVLCLSCRAAVPNLSFWRLLHHLWSDQSRRVNLSERVIKSCIPKARRSSFTSILYELLWGSISRLGSAASLEVKTGVTFKSTVFCKTAPLSWSVAVLFHVVRCPYRYWRLLMNWVLAFSLVDTVQCNADANLEVTVRGNSTFKTL